MTSSLEKALFDGLQRQCELETVSDGAYSITGPLHLGELAEYLIGNSGKVELRSG